MKTLLLMIVLTVLCVSCTDSKLPSLQAVNVGKSEYLDKAEALMRQACPAFDKVDYSIQVMPASEGQATLDGARQYGWTKSAQFSFVVTSNSDRVDHAISNTCTYEIGAEPKAGIIISKKVCVQLCNGPSQTESYYSQAL